MEPSSTEEAISDSETWPDQLRKTALASGASGVRQTLGNSKGNINARNDSGLTALHLIISLEDADLAAFDTEKNSQTQDRGDHQSGPPAAERNLAAVVKVLLDFGADVNASTPAGRGPLFLAVGRGNASIVGLLLGRGAEPDKFSSEDPPTALHLACDLGNPDVVQMLLDGGADVDPRDVRGATPLFRAVASGNLPVTKLLLQRGASTRILNVDGRSVFDLAEKDIDMVQLLQADRTIQGPRIKGFKAQYKPRQKPVVLRPPVSPANRDQRIACMGFHVQIIDFYTEGNRLEMIEKSAPVGNVLYGQGPTGLMQAARTSQMPGQKPNFTWYHLPANNVCPSFLAFCTFSS